MVNYPTILNLPQKDINRQLYERVLKLQVKAKYHVLSLTINDGTDPISGATVVIGETTKTTGTSGGCTFPDMPYDTYSATVSAEGYTSKTESIVFDATHKSFTVSLTATGGTGTVTVTCQDSESNPLAEADVVLFDTQTQTIMGCGITGNDGVIVLKESDGQGRPTEVMANIPYGTYSLAATDSYEVLTYEGTFTVDSAEETVTITLTSE